MEDAQTGEQLLNDRELDAARRAAEARAREQEAARRAAEAKTAELEARLKALEEAQRRGGSPG